MVARGTEIERVTVPSALESHSRARQNGRLLRDQKQVSAESIQIHLIKCSTVQAHFR